MAKLGDFIGTLLADIASARARADIEAIKLAEAYSGHELLKYMPVPRFRLPEVSVDVNVVLNEIAATDETSSAGGKPVLQPSNTEVTKVVRRSFAEAGIVLSAAERLKVYSAAQRRARQLFETAPHGFVDSRKLSTEVASVAVATANRLLEQRDSADAAAATGMTTSLRTGLRELYVAKLAKAPFLNVGVKSSEVKEHGDNDSLLRIRFSIAEDSYEIVAEAADDETTYKLIPE